jgi:2'-5' RNA ligase
MSSLVIVAIPAEDELVWKVSSEKVPHLTLMYLGETTDDNTAQRMADFVEHALNVNQHGPFYLDVDYRGELGPDKADVLYFENGWDSKWIKSLRGQLLKQNDIRTAFEANDQFPEWVPHLTLGYPDTPAKPIPDDRKIYSVQFDRLAVWTGDYSGPEFRLKWPERDPIDLAVAYSEYGPEVVHDLLHFGVKGMRWGQRKTPSVVARPKSVMTTGQKVAVGSVGAIALLHPGTHRNYVTDVQNQRGFEADKKWEKDFNKAKSFKYDDQKFTDSYNKKWEKHDFSKEDWNSPSPTYQKYIDGYTKEMSSDYSKQFAAHYGSSPTGKYKTVRTGDHVHIQRVEAAHSLEDGVLVTFRISFADDGLIDGLEKVEDSMEQATEVGEEFILEHFGVKGMKWGVRKEQLKSGAKSVGRGLNRAATALANHDFENATADGRAAEHIERKAHEAFRRSDLPKINGKPEYQNAKKLRTRLRNPRDPIVKQYRQEVKSTYIKRLEEAANSTKNASGTRQYTIRERGWELPPEGGDLPKSKHLWQVTTREVKHAEDPTAKPFYVQLTIDHDGFVTDLSPLVPPAVHAMELGEEFMSHQSVLDNPTLAQQIKDKLKSILDDVTSDADGDLALFGDPLIRTKLQSVLNDFYKDPNVDNAVVYDALGSFFLEHYGVKGMHWGIRNRGKRSTPEPVAPQATSKVPHGNRRQTKIETQGGENHPAHADAIKVAQAQAKLKKSGTAALSNQELRDVATRVQLENQVTLLTGHKGKQFARQQLRSAGGQTVQRGIARGIATGAAKKGGKAALLFA